jgi:hypothetical protein
MFDKVLCMVKCLINRHRWNEWRFEPLVSGECKKIRTCIQCSVEEIKLVSHNWDKGEYESLASCRKVWLCSQCSFKKTGNTEHDWSEWEFAHSIEFRGKGYHRSAKAS